MEIVKMLKTVGGVIVSVGVGAAVGNVIKTTTPTSVGLYKKICIGVGAFVLSNMVGDKAVEYTEAKIDGAVKLVNDVNKTDEETVVEE